MSDFYFRRDVVNNQNLTGWRDKSDTIPRLLWVDETSVKGFARTSFFFFSHICVLMSLRSSEGRPASIVVREGRLMGTRTWGTDCGICWKAIFVPDGCIAKGSVRVCLWPWRVT